LARYFADTYALVEILRGSPAYRPYADEELVTTEFNLLELAYALTRDYGRVKALEVLALVRAFIEIVETRDEDYVEAAELRARLRREGRRLSLIDALGYAVARRLGIPFLTGDREFRGLDGVVFVK